MQTMTCVYMGLAHLDFMPDVGLSGWRRDLNTECTVKVLFCLCLGCPAVSNGCDLSPCSY